VGVVVMVVVVVVVIKAVDYIAIRHWRRGGRR